MTSPILSDPAQPRLVSDVPCPFCGLACDDLGIEVTASAVRVVANGCARSQRMFGASSSIGTPATIDGAPARIDGAPARIDGAPATLADAIARAVAILRDSTRPAFAGLATDVAGVRATLALAERLGGIVDHLGSRALMRNVRVLQDRGALTTTFAEVRNRADLIVVAGTDAVSRFPRFFERVASGEAMFVGEHEREVVFVGAQAVPEGIPRLLHIHCDNQVLGEVFGAVRALCAGRMPARADVCGIPLAVVADLAERMQGARYGVVVWAAADLDFPHADLAIDAIVGCVSVLNERTRFSSLPLGGNEADVTANQVCLWQTGFPLRTSFAGGLVDHDADRYALDALLAHDEIDAFVWLSSFDAALVPPRARVPTIVLGRRGMNVAPAPAVQIDVATPGLDQAGHFFRGDAVVAVRLRQVAATDLPAAAEVIDRIAAAVGPVGDC